MSVGWGCVDGIEVELWGECYNIEETTDLDLSWSGLTGEIPSEIWHSNWKLTRQNWRNQKIQHRYVNMYTCICSHCKK